MRCGCRTPDSTLGGRLYDNAPPVKPGAGLAESIIGQELGVTLPASEEDGQIGHLVLPPSSWLSETDLRAVHGGQWVAVPGPDDAGEDYTRERTQSVTRAAVKAAEQLPERRTAVTGGGTVPPGTVYGATGSPVVERCRTAYDVRRAKPHRKRGVRLIAERRSEAVPSVPAAARSTLHPPVLWSSVRGLWVSLKWRMTE